MSFELRPKILTEASTIKFYDIRSVQYADMQSIDINGDNRFTIEPFKEKVTRYNLLCTPLVGGYTVNLVNAFNAGLKPDNVEEWLDSLPPFIRRQISYLKSIDRLYLDESYVHDRVYMIMGETRRTIEEMYKGDAPETFNPLLLPDENDFVPNQIDLGEEFVGCRIRNIVHIPKNRPGRDWLQERVDNQIEVVRQATNAEDIQIKDLNDAHILFLEKYREDGSTANEVKIILNGERPIYIAKEDKRGYVQKRIAEPLSNLIEIRTTESDKWDAAYDALGKGPARHELTKYEIMKAVRKSPFLYGVEITFENYCNYYYAKKYPHYHADNSTVAFFDFEADVETRVPSVASIVMRDDHGKIQVELFVNEQSMPDIKKTQKFLHDVLREYDENPADYPDLYIVNRIKKGLPIDTVYNKPKVIKSEKLSIKLHRCRNDMEIVEKLFKAAHIWKPHFLTAWNISYDLMVCVKTCDRYGIRFEDIVSTPGIPETYRYFGINPGNKTFTSASGKSSSRDNHEVWSSYPSSSFFYLIDYMKAHYQLRKGSKVINTGYSLESITNNTFGANVGKMTMPKIDEERLSNAHPKDKHAYLAMYRQPFYSAYNISDNIAGLCILEKSEDLKTKFRALCEVTSFNDFGTSSKRVICPLAMHMLDIDNAVIGNNIIPDENAEAKMVTGDVTRRRITIVLKSTYSDNNNGENGHLTAEDGAHFKNVGTTVSDGDVVSSYPSCGIALSASKTAACRELFVIHARNPQRVRKLMSSLTVGGSYELCVSGMNNAAPIELLDRARKKLIERNIAFKNDFEYLADVKQAKPELLTPSGSSNDKHRLFRMDKQAMLDTAIVTSQTPKIF